MNSKWTYLAMLLTTAYTFVTCLKISNRPSIKIDGFETTHILKTIGNASEKRRDEWWELSISGDKVTHMFEARDILIKRKILTKANLKEWKIATATSESEERFTFSRPDEFEWQISRNSKSGVYKVGVLQP